MGLHLHVAIHKFHQPVNKLTCLDFGAGLFVVPRVQSCGHLSILAHEKTRPVSQAGHRDGNSVLTIMHRPRREGSQHLLFPPPSGRPDRRANLLPACLGVLTLTTCCSDLSSMLPREFIPHCIAFPRTAKDRMFVQCRSGLRRPRPSRRRPCKARRVRVALHHATSLSYAGRLKILRA